MGSQLSVYNLGERGISLVASSVHTEDGDLLSSQNALPDPNSTDGGLSKRGGLARLNSVALAGEPQNFIGVPLPLTLTKRLYAALDTGISPNWRTTTDGTTWANATVPQQAQRVTKLTTPGADGVFGIPNRIASFNRKLYYPINNYTVYSTVGHTPPIINVFDGTNDIQFVTVPKNTAEGATSNATAVGDMIIHDNKLCFTTNDGGWAAGDYSRVFQMDPLTNILKQIGPHFQEGVGGVKGLAFTLCSFQGRLWMGTSGGYGGTTATGQLWSINAGNQTTWTLEHAFAGGWVQSMAVFNGKLYVGVTNSVDTAVHIPTVYVRDAAGVYTVSEAGPGGTSVGTSWYASLIVYGTSLYTVYFDNEASPRAEIRAFDGTAWTKDYDIDAVWSINPAGQFAILGSDLYYSLPSTIAAGGIIRRSAGSWTVVESSKSCRGFLAVLTTEA